MNHKGVYRDESFGIVPLSCERGVWEVFLIQHRHGRYWGFPKGHAEPNETPQQTAERELKEETNLHLIRYLREEPFPEHYQFTLDGRRISKKVSYFVAVVSGDVELQKKEIQDGLWIPVSHAAEKITHQEGKTILAQVIQLLEKESGR